MNVQGVKVAITGGAGFLGEGLARRLITAGVVVLDGGDPAPIGEIVLLDVRSPASDLAADPLVRTLVGGLDETLPALGDVDAVFHLAGVVSSAAEADFDLGMSTNVHALISLLDHARGLASSPVVVFTSSLAVFGQDPAGPPVGEIHDDSLPRPQSSYGVQKFVGEQFVADYTRRGYLRGRSVRLMTVSVRPGVPNAAASSFLSGIIREPLAGLRSTCPVPPDLPVALSSPSRTLDGILRAASASGEEWGSATAVNLPALTTTPRDMVRALDSVAPGASALIDWDVDPSIMSIVSTWPARLVTERAEGLGLRPAASFGEIVREYVDSPL
ncbi:NAD-dependent epimerase/dehydratase family protein [Microbacterium ulmi]|uniref:NAD-dependent epimerase/dehydratase family protein n=1 Tax=Microbacterium ulmi TaxID=179095 RepID=A0A7Y2PZV7_9MICO|nr:NAD-dependent epimerase/dehydratase family protein [Microbacterium ulmi]NII68270.1 nucleoside-diphosphate-sugar epimerase [Microbacterium ulmi]NNH04886.1 NAD-dependent epimerase/dehydratase family protein [Microbacterium ulmi]